MIKMWIEILELNDVKELLSRLAQMLDAIVGDHRIQEFFDFGILVPSRAIVVKLSIFNFSYEWSMDFLM